MVTAEEKAAAKAAEEQAKAEAAAAKEAEKAAAKAAKDASARDAITVKYRDHKGEPTERTFSAAVHGKNFAELAEEFKTTNAKHLISEE
jgi:hypothetical protein